MEKDYMMLMVRKTQYHESDHTAQSNLEIQFFLHQAVIDLLHRIGKNHLKLHMEPNESPHSQDNPKQKKKLEKSHYLSSSKYTTMLVKSKEHGTGTKTEI